MREYTAGRARNLKVCRPMSPVAIVSGRKLPNRSAVIISLGEWKTSWTILKGEGLCAIPAISKAGSGDLLILSQWCAHLALFHIEHLQVGKHQGVVPRVFD